MRIDLVKRMIFHSVESTPPVTQTCTGLDKFVGHQPQIGGSDMGFIQSFAWNLSKDPGHKLFYNNQSLTENPESFSSDNLTPFGSVVRKVVEGKNVVDLGCGPREVSRGARFLAEVFQAKRYFGVDSKEIRRDEMIKNEFPAIQKTRPFRSYLLKDDLINFLDHLELKDVAFLLMGIVPAHLLEGRRHAYECLSAKCYIKNLPKGRSCHPGFRIQNVA